MSAGAFSAIFLALLCVAPAASAQRVQPQSREVEMRWRAMDRNNDGVISPDEWRGSRRSFEVHDWNGDGQLSGNEVRVGGRRDRNFEDDDFNPATPDEFRSWTDEAFASLDHNRDGRIQRREWHYDLETFARVDRNRDGVLSRTEFLGMDGDDDRSDRFEYLDANNNGRIERQEWHGSADAFEWLDRNNDNVLSRAEVVGETTAAPADQFASLDFNGDGALTRAEWHWSEGSFDRRDLNRDGRLTRREFTATAETTSAAPTPAIRVWGNQRWADTGITVRAGDIITVEADGSIQMSTNPDDIAVPAGAPSGRRAKHAPIPEAVAGALIAKVGDSLPILVGDRRSFTAPNDGRLYLGVNDDHLPDNTGEYRVVVDVRER